MKTVNFKVALMMAAVIGSTAFVSCSSDDEESPKGGGMTSKRIAKMTWSDGSKIETTTFSYDAQGRVVKVIETDMRGGSESSTTTTTYTYGGNTIISKAHYVSGNYENEETHTYTLSDGLIVKEVENYTSGSSYSSYTNTYNYTYDSNGYLKTKDRDVEFTWTDGNLTKWDRGDYMYTVSYSDISWPQYYMAYINGTSIDLFLEPLGVWGKMPKNLPKKMVRVYSDGETEAYTIDYTVENGEITKCISQHNDGYTEIITFEWK